MFHEIKKVQSVQSRELRKAEGKEQRSVLLTLKKSQSTETENAEMARAHHK